MLIGALTCCRSEEKLKQARAALGQAAVHLIRINSLNGDPAAVLGYARIWRMPLPGCLPSGGAGEPPSRLPVPTAVRFSESTPVHVCDTDDLPTKIDQHDSLCALNMLRASVLLEAEAQRSACLHVSWPGSILLSRVHALDGTQHADV